MGRGPGRAVQITPTFREELELTKAGHRRVAGIDEAGRGPWAGPVVAGAVILPDDWLSWQRPEVPAGKRPRWRDMDPRALVRDSKLLSAEQRESLYGVITAAAISFGVGVVSAEKIDALGIVGATKQAMREAIAALGRRPNALLVDAVDLSETGLPCKAIIDGDALCGSVAAASIVAKVTRDRLMLEMDRQYPGYGFARHKGYGTREHLHALSLLGPCPIHRRTFAPIKDLLLQGHLFPGNDSRAAHGRLA